MANEYDVERETEVDFMWTDKDGVRSPDRLILPVLMVELGHRVYHTLATTRSGR